MIVFVHGWGFSPAVWAPVVACLPKAMTARCLNLGFYDQPSDQLPASSQITLAVGHSYGVSWLLERLAPSVPLLAVNGFARFCSGSGQQNGTPVRLLDRMITRLQEDPEGVLQDFRARCGARQPEDSMANYDALRVGLELLQRTDQRLALASRLGHRHTAFAALAGDLDKIVPPCLSGETFPSDCLTMVSDGGHLLPLSHPELIANAVVALAATR